MVIFKISVLWYLTFKDLNIEQAEENNKSLIMRINIRASKGVKRQDNFV